MIRFAFVAASALFLALFSPATFAQSASPEPSSVGSVRVTVSMNADGSRTTYAWDTANHKATANTHGRDGKLREKIAYVLDDSGRFASGQVFGPKDEFKFATRYTYDAAGRLTEEAQQTREGAVRHRIVYSYDGAGKQTGYAIYDGAGNLEGQTRPATGQAPAPAKPR